MKKLLIITSEFAEQDSVSTISKNIISSYEKIKDIQVTTVVSESAFNSQFKAYYDFIIFVHPSIVMDDRLPQFITETCTTRTTLIFYVFGDYIRKSPYYLKLENCLHGKKVIFFTASESYQQLVKNTLVNPLACIKLPFPLNTAAFTFKKNSSDKFRQKYKLKKNDIAILYSGRISPQKNIHLVIKAFNKLNKIKKFNKKIKLFIYGNSDDFESATFYEKKIIPGNYFHILNNLIKNTDNIHILPRADHKELARAYCGSNLFVSLSLYHDEDFGYSPLESLCTGTPVVVTNWGGFRDLATVTTQSTSVNYVNVNFKDKFLEINETQLLNTIVRSLTTNKIASNEVRNYRKKYSIATLAKAYESHLTITAPVFNGFHEDFSRLTLALLSNSEPMLPQYQHFYKSFWS